jgi:hypothetical protein
VCTNRGDPHVFPFDNAQFFRQTCNTTGWLMMLENEYFTVSVWTEPSPKSDYSAVSAICAMQHWCGEDPLQHASEEVHSGTVRQHKAAMNILHLQG